MHYFTAGNLWLAFAILVYIGKYYERSEPTMYSVFGIGRYFYTSEYLFLNWGLVAIAAVCFVLHWFQRRELRRKSD